MVFLNSTSSGALFGTPLKQQSFLPNRGEPLPVDFAVASSFLDQSQSSTNQRSLLSLLDHLPGATVLGPAERDGKISVGEIGCIRSRANGIQAVNDEATEFQTGTRSVGSGARTCG